MCRSPSAPDSISPANFSPRRLRGMLRLEALMALVIVSAAFAATSQMVQATNRHQRRHDRRDMALLEAANQLERLLAADWDDALGPTGDAPRSLPASAGLLTLLPTARVEVLATKLDTPTPGKRLQVSIVSKEEDGLEETWATLTAWRYRDGDAP